MTRGLSPTAVKWMLCSAVVPVGFYVGLSARESSEEALREEQRTEALIRRRVRALQQEAQQEELQGHGERVNVSASGHGEKPSD